MNELVMVANDQLVTTSRIVAEKFEKAHRDVLRAIDNIKSQMSTAQFCALFNASEYVASNGKSNPEYLMNRDGYMLLAMGFTGEKALQVKLLFIEAFNKMEKALKSKAVMMLDQAKQIQITIKKQNAESRALSAQNGIKIANARLLAEQTKQAEMVKNMVADMPEDEANAYRRSALQNILHVVPITESAARPQVMLVKGHHINGYSNVYEVAKQLNTEPRDIKALVKRLVDNGFIDDVVDVNMVAAKSGGSYPEYSSHAVTQVLNSFNGFELSTKGDTLEGF